MLAFLLDEHFRMNTFFAQQIISDLALLDEFVELPLPCGFDIKSCAQWFELLADNSSSISRLWKSYVKRASKSMLAHVQDQRRLDRFHRNIAEQYAKLGKHVPVFSSTDSTTHDNLHILDSLDSRQYREYICYECGYTCNTTKGWWNHRQAKHGASQLAPLFVDTSICPACNVDFHTLARCWHHLTDSKPSCMHYVVHNLSALSTERLQAAKELHQQQLDHLTSQGLPPCYGHPPPIKRRGF